MTARQTDSLINRFLDTFSKDEKIPVTEVQGWFKDNKHIPIRTLQWYAQEGLIPSPQFEGRNGFYRVEDFLLLIDTIRIIRSLKASLTVKFGVLRDVLRKYSDNPRRIVDLLLNLIEEFPIFYQIDVFEEEVYDTTNDLIWHDTFAALVKGVDLDKFRILDIEDDIDRKKSEKKVNADKFRASGLDV